MAVQLRTEEDFEDVIIGAKILGCGGGGEESLARVRINYILEKGLKVKVIDPKDVPDEDTQLDGCKSRKKTIPITKTITTK